MRKDVEKLEPLALMVGMYNGEIDMERMIWWFLKKLNIELTIWSRNSAAKCIYSKELKART